MQGRNESSIERPPTRDEHEGLLYGRIVSLNLDPCAIECSARETFDKIRQSCKSCDFWEACAVDLRRDPSSSLWEAYCPNFGVLNAVVAITEALGQRSFTLRPGLEN